MKEAARWITLLMIISWLGMTAAVSGFWAIEGIAPDFLLGPVCFFHIHARVRERHLGGIVTIILLAAASAVGGSAPFGARLLGYALALLILPPGDDNKKRPLVLAAGLTVREMIVVAVNAAVLWFGPASIAVSKGEAITAILLSIPCSMGMFYISAGLAGILGMNTVQRFVSRPDTLADSFAYDRVIGRADLPGT